MPKTFKTEAVVLRSIRFGEADRILHIYSEEMGRISAIAKGVRRTRSRFGGRLEPFVRADLVLHRGRSELMTVTQVHAVNAHSEMRRRHEALEAAALGGQSVLALMSEHEANRPAYNLLVRFFDLCDQLATNPETSAAEWAALTLCFRLKLSLTAGFAPELNSCASCGEPGPVVGFSAREGGVVCSSCEQSAFSLSGKAHQFLTHSLGAPMTEYRCSDMATRRVVDRAIRETLSYHAQVTLKAVA